MALQIVRVPITGSGPDFIKARNDGFAEMDELLQEGYRVQSSCTFTHQDLQWVEHTLFKDNGSQVAPDERIGGPKRRYRA